MEFQGERFGRILDALDSLRPMAENYGLTLAQLAMRWVLTHPALSCAIAGVKRREHIETIVAAVEGTLCHDDWHRMAHKLAEAHG